MKKPETYLFMSDAFLVMPADKGERKTDDLTVLCRVCNALEYLEQKNPDMANRYTVIWDYTVKS